MATCPAALSGQITQLTDLSRLVFKREQIQKVTWNIVKNKGKICFSSSGFITELASN